jgi:hypothetical protein
MNNYIKKSSFLQKNENIIRDIFLDWKNKSLDNSRIVSNLENEHFTNDSKYDYFISKLMQTYSVDSKNYPSLLIDFIRGNLLREGGKIRGLLEDEEIWLVTVIPKKRFRKYLKRNHHRRFSSRYTIDNLITDLMLNSCPDRFNDISLKLSNRNTWVSWNEVEQNEDPLAFMVTDSSEELKTAFGLGYSDYDNCDFLAFNFQTNLKKTPLFRPTTFDSDFSPYFLVTENSFRSYGKTKFLNNGKFDSSNVELQIQSIIHKPEAIQIADYFTLGNLVSTKIYETR